MARPYSRAHGLAPDLVPPTEDLTGPRSPIHHARYLERHGTPKQLVDLGGHRMFGYYPALAHLRFAFRADSEELDVGIPDQILVIVTIGDLE
jgi:hypothetical protein